MDKKMNDGISGAFGAALVKAYGGKAILGAMGAALLYLALPPKKPNGDFDEREFVMRLATAGIFSILLGDWLMLMLQTNAAWLHPEAAPKAVDIAAGAPGWWVTRGIALWFHNREGKDIAQVIKEVKE